MRNVQRTSALLVSALLGAGLVVGVALRPLAERSGGSAPRPGWVAAAVIAAAAVTVGVLARSTWQSIQKDRSRVTSDHAVKLLAIAKSSIIVGALFGGMYLGLVLSFLDAFDTEFGRDRVLQGAVAGVAGLALIGTGLWLERALHIPGDDDEGSGGAANPA